MRYKKNTHTHIITHSHIHTQLYKHLHHLTFQRMIHKRNAPQIFKKKTSKKKCINIIFFMIFSSTVVDFEEETLFHILSMNK